MTGYAERLAPGGLIFLELVDMNLPLIPPTLASAAQGYFPAPRSLPRSLVEKGAPDVIAKANKGWYDLSYEGGLFGDDRHFLVAVEVDKETGDWWWARVRLANSWDVMGAGAAAGLGMGLGDPEFTMLSATGKVIVFVTSNESAIGTVLLKGFEDLIGLRKEAAWTAGWPGVSEQKKSAARRWLDAIAD